MAAVASAGQAGPQAPAPANRPAPHGLRFPVWRWAILLAATAYFLIPLYSALKFAGLKAFPDIFRQSGFISAMGLSLRLAGTPCSPLYRSHVTPHDELLARASFSRG